jgi:hypothetical protein
MARLSHRVYDKCRELTEDELFGRRQHVQREGDFILVALALEPAQ